MKPTSKLLLVICTAVLQSNISLSHEEPKTNNEAEYANDWCLPKFKILSNFCWKLYKQINFPLKDIPLSLVFWLVLLLFTSSVLSCYAHKMSAAVGKDRL